MTLKLPVDELKNKAMKITWQVSDGYVGGSRPQYLDLDIEEVANLCDTPEEIKYFI